MPVRVVEDSEDEEEVLEVEESDDEHDLNLPADLGNDVDPERLREACDLHDGIEGAVRNSDMNLDQKNAVERMQMTSQWGVKSATSFAWTNSGAHLVLNRAIGCRVKPVTDAEKAVIRNHCDTCMFCGREETKCDTMVELCGLCDDQREPSYAGYDASEWAKGGHMQLRVLAPDLLDRMDKLQAKPLQRRNQLPVEYLGAFVVGETCFKWLLLYFHWQSVPVDLVWGAEVELESQFGAEDPPDDELVTHNVRDHVEYLRMIDNLKRLTASRSSRDCPEKPAYFKQLWEAMDRQMNYAVTLALKHGHHPAILSAQWQKMGENERKRMQFLAMAGERAHEYKTAELNNTAPKYSQKAKKRKAEEALAATESDAESASSERVSKRTRSGKNEKQPKSGAKGAPSKGKSAASKTKQKPGSERSKTAGKRRVSDASDDDEEGLVERDVRRRPAAEAEQLLEATQQDDGMFGSIEEDGEGTQCSSPVQDADPNDVDVHGDLSKFHALVTFLQDRSLYHQAAQVSQLQASYLNLHSKLGRGA